MGSTGRAGPMASMACSAPAPRRATPSARLVPTDAAAVTAVVAAQEVADVGEVVIEEADIVADWQRPGYDMATGTLGVFHGDRLVAYADTSLPQPRRRRRPPGPSRAAASAPRSPAGCRSGAASRAGGPGRHAGARRARPATVLLESLGYHVRWTQLGPPAPRGRHDPRTPAARGVRRPGRRPRRSTRRRTDRHRRTPSSSGRCASARRSRSGRSQTVRRPGFEPWHLRVVTDPAGDVVAHGAGPDERRLRVHRPARDPQGPARPRSRPGAARRLVRRRPPSTAR